jgi:transposase
MATKVESGTSRETVYAAIELSKKTWVLGIALPDRDRPSIHRITGSDLGTLVARQRVAARENRRIVVC